MVPPQLVKEETPYRDTINCLYEDWQFELQVLLEHYRGSSGNNFRTFILAFYFSLIYVLGSKDPPIAFIPVRAEPEIRKALGCDSCKHNGVHT